MDPFLISLCALSALGIVCGFLSGLLGVGGGIILVPGLLALGHYIYSDTLSTDILMHMALGTSFAIIIPTNLSSAYAQIKRKAVEWHAIRRMAPGLLLGVVVGLYVASKVDGQFLQGFFGICLYLIAALHIRKPKPAHIHPGLLDWHKAFPTTNLIGFVSTMMGVGGATMNIPYMNFAGLVLHRAIATASILTVILAIPAALGFMVIGQSPAATAGAALPPELVGYVNLKAWCVVVPFSILMAPLGVKVSHKLNDKWLRIIFGLFVVSVATNMVWHAFGSGA